MRISDWSSDVCSSDLERGDPAPFGREPENEAEQHRGNGTDERPRFGRAGPEQAEQEYDSDTRRHETREFLDILKRLVAAAEQRARGKDREKRRDDGGDPADKNQLASVCAGKVSVLPGILRPRQTGRAHVGTPVPNAHPVCRLLLKNTT